MADPSGPYSDIRALTSRIQRLESRIRDLESPSGTQRAQAVTTLQQQVAILTSMQDRQYAEFVNLSGISVTTGTWGTSPCDVSIESLTGRIEVEYGGSLNNGGGLFCFEVTGPGGVIVARDTIRGNHARRVAVTGGVSFTPSGSRSMPLDIPTSTPVTVALHIYAETGTPLFFGGSIAAKVVA